VREEMAVTRDTTNNRDSKTPATARTQASAVTLERQGTAPKAVNPATLCRPATAGTLTEEGTQATAGTFV